MGNEQSVRHEPSPYSSVTSTSAPKQVKSAMRRSRSIRSAADTIESSTQDRTRYIPKMTTAKNGLIMPTRPFGTDVVNNGVESPQLGYGFYTNLTPPTPEMYQSHASKHPRSLLGPSMPSYSTAVSMASGRTQQNQVFQNLQNNQTPMGWTSVPI